MQSSLIITIYKSCDYLNRVLESIRHQTVMPGEIIVTEDGEATENKTLLDLWRDKLEIPLIHLTQKDIGNRKPLATNKGILASRGAYLIFLDGDCVLHRDFTKAHLDLADEKCFLTGRRVELSPKATDFLTAEKIATGYLNGIPWRLLVDSAFGKTHHLGRFFRTPPLLRKFLVQDKILDIRGCNFSVHRKNMLAINGYSNFFSGAYGEDSDVEHRLKFLGLKMKSVKGAAIQYHLWHKTQVKDLSNQRRLENVVRSGNPRTDNGLVEAPAIP